MRSTLLIPSVLVAAVMLIAAGCGGSSKKSSAQPTTAPSAATTTSTTAPAGSAFASSKNCRELAALGAKMSQAMQATSGKGGSDLENQGKAFQAMASAAPSEIRADFETYASALDVYAQAWAKAGFKPGTVPTAAQVAQMAIAVKAFSSPKLQAAVQHLTAWTQKNCTATG